MAGNDHESKDHLFATNHKAHRDYVILETHEAGLELKGTEIKSIRRHAVSLDDSFARVDEGELFLYNMHISPYAQGGRYNADPIRPRKLLMHRKEIERLVGLLTRQRMTLVPLRLYEKHGFAKVALAVVKGKRVFEKRETIHERETDREIQRALRTRQKRPRM